MTGLWTTDPAAPYGFSGEHFSVAEAPAVPQPTQQGGLPLIIGGGGQKRTPSLAARFAAEYNYAFRGPEAFATQRDVVREACTSSGRDPGSLVYSAGQVVCVGATEADVARRADALGRDPTDLRENGIAGSPAEAADKIGRFAEAGADRVYLQVLDEDDVDHIGLIASDVLTQL